MTTTYTQLGLLTSEIVRRDDITTDHTLIIDEVFDLLLAMNTQKKITHHAIEKVMRRIETMPLICDIFNPNRQPIDIVSDIHTRLETLYWQAVKGKTGVN